MAACVSEFHQQREFNFQRIVPGAQHVKRMPEVPCFVIAVPSPCGIRVRIMAAAAVPVGAVFPTGGKMAAVRGGMGNHSGAIAGEGKVLRVNQPKADRRKYGKDGKDFLECGMWIVSGRLSVQDIICDIPAGNRAGVLRFLQFSIGANQFFWFFAVSACRKKRRAGIAVPWVCPESVHKVIIRAEGRQFFQRGAANKDSQGNGIGKDFPHP